MSVFLQPMELDQCKLQLQEKVILQDNDILL